MENAFESYDFLENEIVDIKDSFEKFEKESESFFMDAYLKGSYYENFEKERLCNIKGLCLNKTDFFDVIVNSFTGDDNKIADVCSSIETIKDNYEKENNKSKELIKNYNIDDVNGIIENAKNKKIEVVRKKIFEEINNITPNNKINDSLNILLDVSKANISDEEIDYGNFSENEILSLIQLNFLLTKSQ